MPIKRLVLGSLLLVASLFTASSSEGKQPSRYEIIPRDEFRVVSIPYDPPLIRDFSDFRTLSKPILPSKTATPKDLQTADKAGILKRGKATTYGYGYAGFLALPEGPGHKVTICGPVTCITRISNDAGPDKAAQREGKIVDLNSEDFEIICGCDWYVVGVIKVTVEYLD